MEDCGVSENRKEVDSVECARTDAMSGDVKGEGDITKPKQKEAGRFVSYGLPALLLFLGIVFLGYGFDAVGTYSPQKEVSLEQRFGHITYEKAGRSGNVVFHANGGEVFKCWTGFCPNAVVESCKETEAQALVFNGRLYQLRCLDKEVLSKNHVEKLGKAALVLGYAFILAFVCAISVIRIARRSQHVD